MNRSISHTMLALCLVGVATLGFAAGWHSSQSARATSAAASVDVDLESGFFAITRAGEPDFSAVQPPLRHPASLNVAFDPLRDLKRARTIETYIGLPAKRHQRKRSCTKIGA